MYTLLIIIIIFMILQGNPERFDFRTATVNHPTKSTLTLYIRQKNIVFNSVRRVSQSASVYHMTYTGYPSDAEHINRDIPVCPLLIEM